MKTIRWVLLAAAVVLATVSPPAHAVAQPGDLTAMIAAADAIVAVEILDTDYTATASDGPMYAAAKILGVAKGKFTPGDTVKFGESAWCGPDYERKDRRILFLSRPPSKEYFRAVSWVTACRPGDRLNVFFASEALSRLSLPALQTFLGEVQAVRRSPPRLQAAVVQRERSSLLLSLTLTNTGTAPVWLNPGLLTVSFDARGIRLFRRLRFAGVKPGWVSLAPREGISGTFKVAPREVRGEDRVLLQITHNGAYFPFRSWAGTAAISVRLGP